MNKKLKSIDFSALIDLSGLMKIANGLNPNRYYYREIKGVDMNIVREKAEIFVIQYYETPKRLDEVSRSGNIELDNHEVFEKIYKVGVKPQSVSEHIYGMMNFAYYLKYLYIDIFPELANIKDEDIFLISMIHEYAEAFTGDIPDDGRQNYQEKDKEELDFAARFVSFLPEEVQEKYRKLMQALQSRKSFFYLCDKAEFCMHQARLQLYGHPGSLAGKENPSKSDLYYSELLDTKNSLEIVLGHTLDLTKECPSLYRDLFIVIMEAYFNLLVHGGMPESLRKLY